MRPSRYDDECPMAWHEWWWLFFAGAMMTAFVFGALWLSWRAVFGG